MTRAPAPLSGASLHSIFLSPTHPSLNRRMEFTEQYETGMLLALETSYEKDTQYRHTN